MKKERTVKDWIIATRPWALPASVTPIAVITAYIFWQSRICGFEIDWINAVLSFVLIVVMHSGGNLISDYHDYVQGVDGPECSNGVTWIRSGLFSLKEILIYGLSLVAIGTVIGLVILYNSSFYLIWIGVACLILTVFYSWFKSHVMGELDVLLCFALLPAVGLSYVMTGSYHPETMLVSLTFGLMTVGIVFVNNTRDIANDSGAGLATLCSIMGLKACMVFYVFLTIVPYLLVVVYCLLELMPVWSLLTFVTLPLAIRACRQMFNPSKIATLDHGTAQLQMSFGIMLTVSLVISAVL